MRSTTVLRHDGLTGQTTIRYNQDDVDFEIPTEVLVQYVEQSSVRAEFLKSRLGRSLDF